MSISRRAFVRGGTLGLFSLGLDPLFLDRVAMAARGPGGGTRKTLVVLFQRGAVDGLSMVVPIGDPWYARERSTIALPRGSLLPLNDHFALHPRLSGLTPLWERKMLAAIQAVGSPASTRSHFEAQDAMESGMPDRPATREGWANRILQVHDHDHRETPFRGVAFGPRLPRTLIGSAPSLVIDDLMTFGVERARTRGESAMTQAFASLYAARDTGVVAASAREGFEAIQMLREVRPTERPPENGATYPAGKFGRSLQQIAQLIKSDVGMEIAFADIDGWDTHVNQGADEGQLGRRLQEFGDGIGAFVTDLGPRMRDVVILTMSEFGRTVRENGTGGTDHGHGTAMFLIGESVRGGQVAGRWPGLAPEQRYQGRDLEVTTDFRDLFGEVVESHLGPIDRSIIFPGHRPGSSLGLFA